jgi:hypothetical protein
LNQRHAEGGDLLWPAGKVVRVAAGVGVHLSADCRAAVAAAGLASHACDSGFFFDAENSLAFGQVAK